MSQDKKRNAKKAQKEKKRKEKKKAQHKAEIESTNYSVTDFTDAALELLEKGDLLEAEFFINKAIKKNKNHEEVHYAQGVHCLISKDYEGAITHFCKAIEIKPDFVQAHFNLAGAYIKTMNLAAMYPCLQAVIKWAPAGSNDAIRAKKKLQDLDADCRKQEGVSLLEFIEAQELYEKGFALLQEKDWAPAETYFRNSLNIHTEVAQAWGNLGLCLIFQGKQKDAKKALKKALKINPKYEPATMNLATAKKLKEGDSPQEFEEKKMDYHLDYTAKNRSLIDENKR